MLPRVERRVEKRRGDTGVRVAPRKRRDGKQVWLVRGVVHGRGVVFERATLEKAETLAKELNDQVIAGQGSLPVRTTLPVEKVQDAERAAAMLPADVTFTDAARFYLDHFRPVTPYPLGSAIDEYVEMKRSEAKNSQITVEVLQTVLDTLPRDTHVTSTLDLTEEKARLWVFAPHLTDRSQRDRYDHLNRLCKYLMARRQLMVHPLESIPRLAVGNSPPTVLSVERLAKLLQAAVSDPEGPEMVPFFAMAAMSGARPFELRRAEEAHWFIDEDPAIMEIHRSKTVWRTVELPENLVKILRQCRERGIPLAYVSKRRKKKKEPAKAKEERPRPAIAFSKRKFDRIRKAAEVYDDWDNDILRHSSSSYIYARTHDIRWLAANYGNSEKVLFKHYIRRSVRRAEAEAFARLSVDWSAAVFKQPRK